MDLVARIFRKLPAAEVILTFAVDALINFLEETPSIIKAVAPIALPQARVRELIEERDGRGGRALAQRTLCDHIRTRTSATYDTPFFIRPRRSRRALWFLHLSRHPTARDVMIQRHWEISNTFEHYGPGDFGMLGWEGLHSKTLPLFHFTGHDAEQLRANLLNSLPEKLFGLVSEHPITVDTMWHMLANKTAARFSDLDQTVLRLFRERELRILDPDGKVRSHSLRRLRSSDQIALPDTLLLPGFSRRR